MERELKMQRTDKGRRKIELKYEARKSQSAARTARPLMSKKTLNEQALEAGTESYFFDQKPVWRTAWSGQQYTFTTHLQLNSYLLPI